MERRTSEGLRGRGMALVAVALWAGGVAGLVELGVFVARVELMQHGLYRRSLHCLWTIPVADLVMVGMAGVAVLPVRWLPRVGGRLAGWLVCALVVATPLLAVPGLRSTSIVAFAAGLACWIEPAVHARSAGFQRLVRASLPLLGLAVLALGGVALGCEHLAARDGRPGGPAPAGAPNIVFIVMDTVRADATSLNPGGSSRDTTPNLAALARRGVRFERAIATAPWTLPSHASMFTGRWPWELAVGPDRALDARYPTLAACLARRGYATAGFIANTDFCTREYGLSRGFGHYEDFVLTPLDALRSSALGWLICRRIAPLVDRVCEAAGLDPAHPLDARVHRKDAAEINHAALRWAATTRDRPFFMFLNYLDTHDPYLVPAGAAVRPGRRAATRAERRLLRDWIDEQPRARSPDEIRLARSAYDDCLAYLDDQIGRLIAALGRQGRLENTVIVVTSDHGEHFGEHTRDGTPLVGHSLSLYQPEIHVPLLIVAPGRVPAGTVVSDVVSLRDLPATVASLAGLGPDAPLPGRSLVRPLAAGTPGAAFAELTPSDNRPFNVRYQTDSPRLMRAVVAGNATYHRHGQGREELYDLQHDPDELRNLAAAPVSQPSLDPYRTMMNGFAPSR